MNKRYRGNCRPIHGSHRGSRMHKRGFICVSGSLRGAVVKCVGTLHEFIISAFDLLVTIAVGIMMMAPAVIGIVNNLVALIRSEEYKYYSKNAGNTGSSNNIDNAEARPGK